MRDPIIETRDLSKLYHMKDGSELLALNRVSLEVQEGEIFGLLGPNGAGKTTLINILATLLHPTSGTAIIDGKDIIKDKNAVKSKIGLMAGAYMLYSRLTAFQNLKFYTKIYGVPNYKQKIYEVMDALGLKKWTHEYLERFSTGMRIKVALARVLVLDPKIMILDEPTLGLDVKSVKKVVSILKNLNKTIVITSHDMNVVQKVCDRIAFINRGQILNVDTPANLQQLISAGQKVVVKVKEKQEELAEELESVEWITEITRKVGLLKINMESNEQYPALFRILQNYPVVEIEEQKPALEDIFLKFYYD